MACGIAWAGDTRRRVRANLDVVGDAYLVTITAPGVEPVVNVATGECWVLRWDHSYCAHAAGTRCSGLIGCRCEPADVRPWNETARERWSKLHRRAWERVKRRREREGLLCPPVYDCGVWERQRRGADHRHLVLPAGTMAERQVAHEYVNALDELTAAHGFGNIDAGKPRRGSVGKTLVLIERGRVGTYVSKYLAPLDSDGKPSVSESAKRMRGHVVYVAKRLTDQTGVTMRALREQRVLWTIGRRHGVDEAGAITLRELQRGLLLERDAPELIHLVMQLRGPPEEVVAA